LRAPGSAVIVVAPAAFLLRHAPAAIIDEGTRQMKILQKLAVVVAAMLSAALVAPSAQAQTIPTVQARNVVLIHGAWADGSSWSEVIPLLQAAGLKVQKGIVLNEFLQTTEPDVYAAGDAAEFFNPALTKYIRVEHEDNANTMGRVAGLNMAGKSEAYHHLPFFYSDLFELGYEAVGELDAQLETFADWKTPFREGVVYYLRDGRVRGVLLWNVWGQVDAARNLISESGPFKADELKGRLPKPS